MLINKIQPGTAVKENVVRDTGHNSIGVPRNSKNVFCEGAFLPIHKREKEEQPQPSSYTATEHSIAPDRLSRCRL